MSSRYPTTPRRRRSYLRQLRERDGDDCQWCGKPFDFTLPREDPMAWSFDHIVPHAEGGPFCVANLQLMHRHCNEIEGRWEVVVRKLMRGTRHDR